MGNSRDQKLYQKTKHTITGWFNTHYKRMRQLERKRFGKELCFDRWDFEDWVIETNFDKFCSLFSDWIKKGYATDYCPSIDRLDNSKGYVFDNMQIITWKENNEKEHKRKKEQNYYKAILSTKRAVIRISECGETTMYESLSEAGRQNNISNSVICECCKGKRRSAYGYKWKYAD